MVDTFHPLKMTDFAASVEDNRYMISWIEQVKDIMNLEGLGLVSPGLFVWGWDGGVGPLGTGCSTGGLTQDGYHSATVPISYRYQHGVNTE